MKYIMIASVLILFCSCSRYYQGIKRLAFSLSKSEKYIERIKTANFHGELIAKMRGRTLNYRVLENSEEGMDEFENYRFEMDNEISKMSYLNLHNMFVINKWIIRRDKLSRELFLGTTEIAEVAQYEELLINSRKMNIHEVQKLPTAENYNVKYNKYSYDHCNRKIDTFSISRVIDFNGREIDFKGKVLIPFVFDNAVLDFEIIRGELSKSGFLAKKTRKREWLSCKENAQKRVAFLQRKRAKKSGFLAKKTRVKTQMKL